MNIIWAILGAAFVWSLVKDQIQKAVRETHGSEVTAKAEAYDKLQEKDRSNLYEWNRQAEDFNRSASVPDMTDHVVEIEE